MTEPRCTESEKRANGETCHALWYALVDLVPCEYCVGVIVYRGKVTQ